MAPARGGPALRALIATALVCGGYYAGGVIGMGLRLVPGGPSEIWLPQGIVLAALLAAPLRRWWLYSLALLLTHMQLTAVFNPQLPISMMFSQFAGQMVQTVVAAALLRPSLGTPPRLDTLRRMGTFILVGTFLVPCVVQVMVVAGYLLDGYVHDFWAPWQQRVLARVSGAVIIAAPILHFTVNGWAAVRRRWIIELVSLTACLSASMVLLFAWRPGHPPHQWLVIVPLPFLLWSAVRFGPGALGMHLLGVVLVALLCTKAGRGPFATGSVAQVIIALQGFFLFISIPLMLLAALVWEHARAAARLRRSEEQYRSVVEDQADLICRFLADGTYTFVNAAHCRYLQRSAVELLGRKCWDFARPDYRIRTEGFLATLTPQHPVASFEYEVAGPGGEPRWMEWTDRGFFDDQGRIIEFQAVGHDITDRKRAEQMVRQSEEQVRHFVRHVPAAVAMFDRDMRYLIYSPRWLTDYKLGDQDLVGRSYYDVFPEIPECWKEVHRRCLAGATELREDDSFVRTNGTTEWLRWEARPWRNARNEIGGIIMFTEVITERKRAEEEHRRLVAQARVAEALQEVDRRKDEFLAMVSHELRNPLTPITTAVEIMREREPADDSIVWARDVIGRQAAQLTRLVDDLLDVSRITLGKITLDRTVLDLRPIVAQAVETAQPLLAARRHALSVDVPPKPLPIRGDGARLTQIVSNLLTNAARFTADGGRIALAVRRDGAQVVLSVKDNGVGIPPDMRERMFDMFTQIEWPAQRKQEGLGIGLALVKRLVQMHDGEVEARSEGPGCGSELVVRLPLATDGRAPAGRDGERPADGVAGDPRDAAPGARPERILVVDDNVDAAESLSRLLRMQAHEVRVEYDGLAAVAAARDMNPDVVLLDIGLPKLDGLEVAKILRARPDGPRPLLVAMTGFGQARDRARTAAAGFDHHLTKPIDPKLLQSLMQTARGARA
ncbi:MAG TPA: PAS domain-containing protein [Polyangia bacterium]|nr:PAS domain-containing protein [Polyangia bacterium]